MIDHIPALIASGVRALKIEGRMKGIHYVAATVKAYREAIDAYYRDPEGFRLQQDWLDLLGSVNQRGYCTGFYFGDPREVAPNLALTRTAYYHRLVGKIIPRASCGGTALEVRNRLAVGDEVEILSPGRPVGRDVIAHMRAADGTNLEVAHAGMRVDVDLQVRCRPNDLLQRCDEAKGESAPPCARLQDAERRNPRA
jgi:putative protease